MSIHPVPHRASRALKKSIAAFLATATSFTALSHSSAEAADQNALLDTLVRKGVLTDREAASIREETVQAEKQNSASKLKLSPSITELKLYGDLRLRYQYDDKDPQLAPAGIGGDEDRNPSGEQRSRWRFRLRLNADFKLAENFFGGVGLETAVQSDSGNETFQDGFRDYPIFISKAYLGWSPNDSLTVTAGKVPNPFYTTDLIWDSDIFPTGITQSFALHKLWEGSGSESESGLSKDGKKTVAAAAESPWELTLVAGQFIFDDNLEGGGRDPGFEDNDRSTDAYLFQTQLLTSYRFSKAVKLTAAPGWLVYNSASAQDLENNNDFEDNARVSGATRNLNILLLPGDLSFKLWGTKAKFYWDLAYNIEGRKRVEEIYGLAEDRIVERGGELQRERLSKYSERDNFAWLAGLQLGENKERGDWSVLANYRETGLGAVDPNLNDSDFADSQLNSRGVKFSLGYNLTSFAVVALTYQHAWQLRDLVGGEATGGNSIADANEIKTLQVDLSVKF